VGLLAPAKTDSTIVARLHQEVAKAMKNSDVVRLLATEGGNDLIAGTPVQFTETLQRELIMYRKLIQDAGIKQQ
jgi:tripartite-type tricarboxylate transporter receptor subunit TctC